ncbi:lysophospholipid acyltransferase family protein [Rathayibacter iranicus]|uniref:1-acyl-sn-glycerol-3-phosphate acyltransferase n=2 Tax=Rathayibacter iranicus TaxID=59737 RepID=A0AAD1EP10_9MICO|nr:lysophospholipid acyltransferase family protein [Rathayibacter iranicus]AZZ57360.1 1-acyl-sn-glycerol-3-phosphate acyltransferase [Rathayibacter iranicus]MWV31070.1 1-acyl-sn-glycerol-3-phosphate acyltransferase [Rathayibacter iranicus NCPPB 2253 = VKM Ac-1602]PPI47945.1 1-acyl-sn-glycerol-3-phosphate acyltransferase [Rathayibacter iranicus]PPI61137.1 1-acyl-sn-glycerol-3-phosphate acyltransferase [Rathayibacter iranicus]PPI73036.1 1-acyl-sn-glycerol-3-phosphate acyltransferase [Rathayibact
MRINGDDERPTPPGIGLSARLARLSIGGVGRLIYRPVVEGRENVPASGRVILASNHLSFIDSPVLTLLAPRPVQFLAKSEYFTGTGARGAFSRAFFTAVGAVAVERGAGQAAQEALDLGRAILERDEAFAVYPEGTRSRDGRLYKGRTGVAWLALTTGAPVVPVGLIGTQELQPVGTRVPRLHRITVRFGAPLDLSSHGSADSGRARRRATDEVMGAIHALSEQELAGAYNESPPTTTAERIRRAFPHERR